MRIIGLVGGISHYATLEYYRRIMDICIKDVNGPKYPEIIIYNLSFDKFKAYEDAGNKVKYIGYIGKAIEVLINSGAKVLALAANSPHSVIDELEVKYNIKFVSSLESALIEALRLNIKKAYCLVLNIPCSQLTIRNILEKMGLN